MKTKVDINPIIEKLIDGSDKALFDKINDGKPFYVGNRKYKIVSK